jgi:DNA-binding FadR family transcriptional regulator
MAHDRIDGDRLPLTHEFLSLMLGVRRSGVTTALQALERKGPISRNRANILASIARTEEASERYLRGVRSSVLTQSRTCPIHAPRGVRERYAAGSCRWMLQIIRAALAALRVTHACDAINRLMCPHPNG